MKRIYVVPATRLGRSMTTAKMGNKSSSPPAKQGTREMQRRARQLAREKAAVVETVHAWCDQCDAKRMSACGHCLSCGGQV